MDPTPLWASRWRLMLKGPLKEPLALPTKDAANEPIVYPKPIEEFEGIRSLIENVVAKAFLNPRSIGRAVRLGRRWAEVGYDEPLYYCLVQVGQPSVTIYAFQARVDAVVHTGEAILASGDKGVSAFHVGHLVNSFRENIHQRHVGHPHALHHGPLALDV